MIIRSYLAEYYLCYSNSSFAADIHNPNFNYGEFAIIRSNAGLNSYKISVKEWTEKTNAIGIFAKAGRYQMLILEEKQGYKYLK